MRLIQDLDFYPRGRPLLASCSGGSEEDAPPPSQPFLLFCFPFSRGALEVALGSPSLYLFILITTVFAVFRISRAFAAPTILSTRVFRLFFCIGSQPPKVAFASGLTRSLLPCFYLFCVPVYQGFLKIQASYGVWAFLLLAELSRLEVPCDARSTYGREIRWEASTLVEGEAFS